MLTHRNLLAMTLNYLADVDRAAVGEHLLHAAPMSHGSGLYTIPNVAAGATQVIPAARGFDVDEMLQILAYTPATKFFAAPTMVMRLVDAVASQGSSPEHLKTVIYGGGPMYVADSVRALDVLGPRLVQIYGQGESPMTITVLTAAEHMDDHDGRRLERLGSVGRAQVGVEVTVLDEAGHPVAPGEIGEVCVRGDTVMAGYLNNPQATAEALARRLAAHRRSRPLRRGRLPDAGRSQQGPDHLRRVEHLSARSRGGACCCTRRSRRRR